MTIEASILFTVKSLLEDLEVKINQKNNLRYLIEAQPDFSRFDPDVTTFDNAPFFDYRAKCVTVLKLELTGLTPPEVASLLPGRLQYVQLPINRLLNVLVKQYGLDINDDTSGPQSWLIGKSDGTEAKAA